MESLHVEVSGSGPAVLLQHGLAGSARNWRPQVRALRDAFRVITFDARGHARSAARATPSRYALDDFVADFRDVADTHAGAAPLVVGGLSLGAAVALHFALRHPERVRALVLAAVPGGRGATHGFSAHANAFAAAIDADGLEAAGERFVWGSASGLDASAAALVKQGFLEHPPAALSAILRQTLATLPSIDDLTPQLAGLGSPALVVVGDADRGSLAPSRALAAALPNAREVVIPGAGHVVNLAARDAFNAALEGFLSALPPA